MTGRGVSLLLFAAACLVTQSGPRGALEAQDAAAAPMTEALPAGSETSAVVAAEPDIPEVAAVRETADEFVRAFNAGDAKAVAALWTPGGDYTEAHGEQVVGRELIEQTYAEFFQKYPKATIEVAIEAIKVRGPNVAIEEGTTKLSLPGLEGGVAAGRYSALHVRDAEGWKMASVTEWPDDPVILTSLEEISWLIGDWQVAAGDLTARISYAWDEGETFIRGQYRLSRGEETVSTGSETIARDPAGGLRSWRFDSSGAFAESFWTRDEHNWIVEGTSTLPDGSDASAVVVLTPLDENAFLWQSTARTAGGAELPGTRPLKVSRDASVEKPEVSETTTP